MTVYGSPLTLHQVRRVRRLRLRAQRSRLRTMRRRTPEAAFLFDPAWVRAEQPTHVRAA